MSHAPAVNLRTEANAPAGDGLTVSGAHTAAFGRLASICQPNTFFDDTGLLAGVMTYSASGQRYDVSIWLQGYSLPRTYELGEHGGKFTAVSLAFVSLSPADQQSYGATSGTIVVTSDDHRVARGTMDVQLTAAAVPGGFPPDGPIRLTGTWSCPRQG